MVNMIIGAAFILALGLAFLLYDRYQERRAQRR